MPKKIFNFVVSGNNVRGGNRFETAEEVQALFEKVVADLESGKEFIYIHIGDNASALRARDISSFGIHVTLEETPEERKARALQRLEQQDYENGPCVEKGYATGGLIGGYIG